MINFQNSWNHENVVDQCEAIQPGEQDGNLNTSLIKVRAKKFPFTDLKL